MDKNFFLGILIGGVVGAGLGILLAPASGIETRSRITEQSKKAAERFTKAASTVTDKAREVGYKVKQAI